MRAASRSIERRAGVTLLETVLALALIGLVATLALPRSPRDSGTSLRIKAYEVMALLRADRDAARAGGVATRRAARHAAAGRKGKRAGIANRLMGRADAPQPAFRGATGDFVANGVANPSPVEACARCRRRMR